MELQLFNFEDIQVQVYYDENNQPWFLAHEVCSILEIKNSRQAVTRLSPEDKQTVIISDSLSKNPNRGIINEYGLYDLVFVSRTEKAKRFKHWLTHEVIPSIRKTGSYNVPQTLEQQALLLANQLIEKDKEVKALTIATSISKNIINQLKAKREVEKPKADYCDKIVSSEGSVDLSYWWKNLGGNTCGFEGTVHDIFHHNGWLMWQEQQRGNRRRLPKAEMLSQKYLELKYDPFTKPTGEKIKTAKIFVTPRGKLYFAKKLGISIPTSNQMELL